MKIEDVKCDWLIRLAELRWEQEDNGEYYLIDMFCWCNTPEGHDSWECVNNEEITNKEQALGYLTKNEVIIKDEEGKYSFTNGCATDKLYNE